MPTLKSRIIIGADHAGVALKSYLVSRLAKKGYVVKDVGSYDKHAEDDYPDVAVKVARHVATAPRSRGILICGTGTGMVIAANKIPGIRAALCYDAYSARMAREHNDANVLTLRGRNFSKSRAWKITKIWLAIPFSSKARHLRRIKKIARLDVKR